MFTGLVEQVGKVNRTRDVSYGREIEISSDLSSELDIGQSVAINGCCLSVTECSSKIFKVQAVPETISKTNLGDLRPDSSVNLERALILGSRLDGHMVQGHIDTVCTITRVSDHKDARVYEFLIPVEYSGLIVARGSIALDGISLTIADLRKSHISIAIIPQTYLHTNVPTWQSGTQCNVEFDVLAKYVERLMSKN